MTLRRTGGTLLTLTLVGMGLSLGLAEATNAQVQAAEPPGMLRASAATIATPTGNLQPAVRQAPAGPRATETSEQIAAAARSVMGQQRPAVSTPDTTPLGPPGPQFSLEGLNPGVCCGRPPDTHGAVGLRHFVEITNVRGVGMWWKDGTPRKFVSLASFFGYTAQTIFDSRVVYDKTWNRWVVFGEAFQESSTVQNVFLAVSVTSDPEGAFYRFGFDVPEPAGDFFDFPQLGMDQDALIVTANIFTGNTYVRSRMFGIPKANVYNGHGFSVPYFNLGTPGTVAPPIVEDNNTNAYLVAASVADPFNLKLFRATNLGRSGASVVFQANVPVPGFSIPPSGRQPGTTNRLDSLNARFQNASTQIGDQLLNIHTIATGTFPTPKWYQIDTEGTGANTVPVGRSGFVLESSESDDFNPSIVGTRLGGTSTNPIGRMYVTWTSTDVFGLSQHQARVKVSGRLATDPTNIIIGSNFAQATNFYNPSTSPVERWGDYSAVTIDPVALVGCPVGSRAWAVNERHIAGTVWGSRIGRVGYC